MINYLIQLIVELGLIIILFLHLFVSNNITFLYVLIALIIFLVLSLLLNKTRFGKSRSTNYCILITGIYSLLLVSSLYLVGNVTGLSTNYSSMFKNYVEHSTIIEIFLIVIVSEIIRYIVCSIDYSSKRKNYIIKFLLVILLVLVDCSITNKTSSFSNFNQFYDFFGLVLLSSISKNVLLNYIVIRYGIKPNLVYRLIMDLYIYFLPVIPSLNVFIESSIYLVYPYFLYTVLEKNLEDNDLEDCRKKKHSILLDIPVYVIGIVIVVLVSREFTYSMIAIGSGSMTGSYNKGDAVIYKSYDKIISTYEDKKLSVGDVIVFNMNGKVVVHRIHDMYSLYGEDMYITKGDANQSADNWVVTQDDIIGVVKCGIRYIAWPSVWLTENYKS